MAEPNGRTDLADLEQRAAAALGTDLFRYFAGGAGDETAVREAERAWARWRFRPRVLRDVAAVDLTCDLLGTRLPHPVLVAPTASHGLLHPDGEIATARGAADSGSTMIVSTRASRRLEEIAAGAGRWWLQVYVTRSRHLVERLVERAVDSGADALVLTGDTPYVGRKSRGRPVALDQPSALVNFAEHIGPDDVLPLALEQDPSVTLDAIGWLRDLSGLPVLVKGVLHPDDAAACVGAGAAGIIVSNHGGRQLGRAVASADALESVVQVCGDIPVLVDGGLRCGEDILAALALGARAVLLGRPVLWGLADDGAGGVARVIGDLVDDLRFHLRLLGATATRDLDRTYLFATDRRSE